MLFWKNTNTLDALVAELADTVSAAEAEIAVIGSKPINLDTMPQLKGIFKCGVGTDNVPFKAAEEAGIRIGLPSAETSRFIFEETANFTVHLVLQSLYRSPGDLANWKKYPRKFLGNCRVLVLGQGNIGGHVARKLKPLVDVLTFDVLHNKPEELKRLMQAADVVTLHIPLAEETKGFIDAEKLSWMQHGATLVNTARGPVVDEEALESELEAERLYAAFDVFWKEPYDGRLKRFHPHRFAMTPHISSNCDDFLIELAKDLRAFVGKLESGQL